MYLTLKAIAATCILAIGSTFACASNITDLSERDWLTTGDGALTYDKSTGLEWLDLTKTTGNSLLDTESESFYGEFRWATKIEIEGLLDSAIYDGPTPSIDGFRSTTNLTDVNKFMELFGVTFSNGVFISMEGVSRELSLGIDSYYGQVYDRSRIEIRIDYDIPQATRWPLGIPASWNENSHSDYVGSWLVRVPEPTTLSLLCLGLAALVGSRRQKKT